MRTVVITGATRGFGKLMVEEFIANGDRVIATGRRLTQRPEIFAELRQTAGARLIEADLDITVSVERDALANLCAKEASLDILVNNAGAGLFGATEDCSERQIREQFELNFFATVFLTQQLLPLLRKSRGKIFNVSSALGFMGFPLTGLYCATKFAIEGWSESLSYELRPHGVRVCIVEPGGYPTEFTASQTWGETNTEAYRNQTRSYEALRDQRLRNPSAQNPREVARGVVALSTKRRLPLRRHFGHDAAAGYWSRRLLPRPLYEFIFHFVFARLFPAQIK